MRPAILVSLVALALPSQAALEFRVTPGVPPLGDPRSLDAALLKLARERERGDRSPATIVIEPGIYFLGRERTLNAKLVGDGLTIRALEGADQPVVLSGGMPIEEWMQTKGPLAVASVKLPEGQRPIQIFALEGHRPELRRARSPNQGYWRIEKSGPDRRTSFTWQSKTVPAITDPTNLELQFLHDWSTTRVKVKSLDPKSRTLTTTHPIGPPAKHYAIDHFEKQPRFRLVGSRELADERGEWIYEPRARQISLFAGLPGAEGTFDEPVVVPRLERLLTIAGTAENPVRNLAFERISFSHAHWQPPARGYAGRQAANYDATPEKGSRTVPASVHVSHAERVTFASCSFTQSAGGGLWIEGGCNEIAVAKCSFRHLGANGLMIGEHGNPKQTTTKVLVEECEIAHCGTEYFGSVGVWIGMAADCLVTNCEISQLPYTGISLGWRWSPTPSPCKGHRIEKNHIHHVLLELSDGGGIYTLGRQPGTILSDNHIHDVRVNLGRAESNGIFMDEGTTDLIVKGNHIHDIAKAPVRFHRAGKNLLLENKLRPKKGVPELRFNNTPEENITVKDPQ